MENYGKSILNVNGESIELNEEHTTYFFESVLSKAKTESLLKEIAKEHLELVDSGKIDKETLLKVVKSSFDAGMIMTINKLDDAIYKILGTSEDKKVHIDYEKFIKAIYEESEE